MIFGSFLLHFASFSPVPCIQLAQARFGACLRSKVPCHIPSIWCGVDVELHRFPYVWILGVSWYCLPSTCCICFDRSRGTYSCIIDDGVAFQMPFLQSSTPRNKRTTMVLDIKDIEASVQFSVGGCVGGLGWTNMNFGPQGQEHQTHSKLPSLLHPDLLTSLHTKEVMSERSAFDTSNVKFSLTKPEYPF